MRSCKVNTTQVLGVVGGCTERVNKGSVREGVRSVALHIHRAVCDYAIPLLARGCADGTFIREPLRPRCRRSCDNNLLPSPGPRLAMAITARRTMVGAPASWVSRRQAVREAVYLPRFVPKTICFQNCLKPFIFCAMPFGQVE